MFANFTEETCTGTGATLALAGATTGNLAFSESFADGDLVAYVLEDSGGSIKVAGFGTYVSATDDITRNDTWNYNGTSVDEDPTTNITLSGGTHTVRCDVINKSLTNTYKDGVPSTNHFTADNLRYNASDAEPGNKFGATAGRYTLITARFHSPTKITAIGFHITTASAGGNMRAALYKMDADGTPSDLIVDSGDISTASTGLVYATLSSPIVLPAGDYYQAAMADNTVVRAWGCDTRSSDTGVFGGRQGRSGTTQGGEVRSQYDVTYGAFPSTVGTSSGTTEQASIEAIYQ